MAAHSADLGGADYLTTSQLSLIRRSATLCVELEAMDGRLADGGTVDLDLYARLSGHLRRIYEVLGLKRVARNITPNIREYLAREGKS